MLPAFADEAELRLNTIVELNSMTINKYELITESGQLKLDRVGYSSLAYPFAYGCIPRTWDEDGDPLDIEIVGVTEPLVPGSLVEARIIGEGVTETVPMTPDQGEPGTFVADWTAPKQGDYLVEVIAKRGEEELGRDTFTFRLWTAGAAAEQAAASGCAPAAPAADPPHRPFS